MSVWVNLNPDNFHHLHAQRSPACSFLSLRFPAERLNAFHRKRKWAPIFSLSLHSCLLRRWKVEVPKSLLCLLYFLPYRMLSTFSVLMLIRQRGERWFGLVSSCFCISGLRCIHKPCLRWGLICRCNKFTAGKIELKTNSSLSPDTFLVCFIKS